MEQISEQEIRPSGSIFGTEAIIAIGFATFFLILNTVILFKSSIPGMIVNKLVKIFPFLKFFGLGSQSEVQIAPRINTETCCFCCADIQKEVGATCGHIYCGKCLIEFWESKNKTKIQCPLCRRPINMIIINFSRLLADANDEVTRKIVDGVKCYNICFSNQPRTIYQIIQDSPYLINRLLSSLSTREGFIFFLKRILGSLYILMLIAYILSPFDLIPDYLIIGWIDDAIVLVYLIIYITILYYNFLQERN